MTDQEFAAILALGRETFGVEFKEPGPISNGRLVAQVVRAVLAMANRRDGGRVIIGVDDNAGELNPVGLSATDLATWHYDNVADQIARYADPGVSFNLVVTVYKGASYVVLAVAEFPDIPVLCKRAYDDVLRDGACYVRTRRKPETSEIPTQTEMRELLDLAVEKRVRQYLEQARRVGLYPPTTLAQPTDQERFGEQLGELR